MSPSTLVESEGSKVCLKPKNNSEERPVQLKSHIVISSLGKISFGKTTELTSHLFVDVGPLQGSLYYQPRTNPNNHGQNLLKTVWNMYTSSLDLPLTWINFYTRTHPTTTVWRWVVNINIWYSKSSKYTPNSGYIWLHNIHIYTYG